MDKQSLESLSRIAWDSVNLAASFPHSTFPFANGPFANGLPLGTAWRSNGFSDSAIYRFETDVGDFAIRSWPNRFDTPSKVEFWSSINEAFSGQPSSLLAAGAANSTPFPQLVQWRTNDAPPSLLLPFADRLWTLCDWVEGEPLGGNAVSKATVQHLATILGKLHGHSFCSPQVSSSHVGCQRMRSNSIRERLELMKSIDYRLLVACDPIGFFSSNLLLDKVQHCLAIVLERQPSWLRFLMICESQARDCHWIVRDLWCENILVDDRQRFSSIVDLGASRLDWPGLDFVRLFGSLSYRTVHGAISANNNSDNDLWDDAYRSYTQAHSNHAIESLDECRMLHRVSLGLSIAQWVLWGKAGNIDLRNSDQVHRVVNRIASLCDQMLSEAI